MGSDQVAKTVCHLAKSGGGERFTSDNARFGHFANTIREAHRLYETDSPKWNVFFKEYSSLNITDAIKSVEHALVERKRIIDSFKLTRKVPQNSAYAFQLFLGASECFAPDWRTSEADQKKWEEYFIASEQWVRKYFPNKVLSIATHYDEKVPHQHVTIIPIRENVPIYHNEKLRADDGSFILNSNGKIKTRKVMTLDALGKPILVTKYTSGNFMNPDELEALQTDYAHAVQSFGVVRGAMNSQSRHEDIRESTRIHARKLVEAEERLQKEEAAMLQKKDEIEKRIAEIKHLLEVPYTEFKIVEPEKKALPMLFDWEFNGKKCKNFEDYRHKIIEEQVSARVYHADLQVQNAEKRISVLSNELAKQKSINANLTQENLQLRMVLYEAPLDDIEKVRKQRDQPMPEQKLLTERSCEHHVHKQSR
jgi:hypothetical protein